MKSSFFHFQNTALKDKKKLLENVYIFLWINFTVFLSIFKHRDQFLVIATHTTLPQIVVASNKASSKAPGQCPPRWEPFAAPTKTLLKTSVMIITKVTISRGALRFLRVQIYVVPYRTPPHYLNYCIFR